MATINEVVSKDVQGQINKLVQQLEKVYAKIIEINQNGINLSNSSTAGNTTELTNLINAFNRLSRSQSAVISEATRLRIEEQALQQALNRTTVTNNQAERSTISLTRARETAERQAQREAQRLQTSQSLYNRTQQQINNLTRAYNDLAVKKERYGSLTDHEERRLNTLRTTLEKYNAVLKGVDANIGRFGRNVGNYGNAFNPLNNSVMQLGRELPALGNGIQTFMMAIGNNVGAFQDAMRQIIAENRILREEGKPTTSVLRQLAGAVFNWTTAVSIGTTLLIVFSKQISEYLFKSETKKKKLEEEKKIIEEKNRVEKEAFDNQVKYGNDEITRSQLLFSTAKNTRLSYQQRIDAIKELQQRYPTYLGQLSQEEFLAGKTASAEYKLNEALMKRAVFLSLQDKIKDVTKKVVEAEVEYAKATTNSIKVDKLYDNYNVNKKTKRKENFRLPTEEDLKSLSNLRYEEERYQESLKKGIILGRYEDNERRQKILPAKEELEILFKLLRIYEPYNFVVDQSTKKHKEKTKAQKEFNFSYVKEEYELRQAILEFQLDYLESQLNNEKKSFFDRSIIREMYSKKTLELINMESQKETALSIEKYTNDVDELNKAFKKKQISFNEYNKQQAIILRRYTAETDKIDVETSDKFKKLREEDRLFFEKIEEQKKEITRNANKYYTDIELKRLEKIKENSRFTLKIRQDAFEESVKIQRKELELAKQLEIAQNPNRVDEIVAKYKSLEEELNNLVSPLDKAREASNQWLDGIASSKLKDSLKSIGLSSIEMFVDFDKNMESSFMKLMQGFDAIENKQEKFYKKFAATFIGVSEILKEAYSLMNQSSDDYFRAELERNEQQKNIAIKFAGESSTAKEEIERQYEEKRKEIQRRQAQAAKEAALFNTIINTAQAVVSALASAPFPTNLPLSITVGVIGAAQAAMIAARPLPEFWTGTDNAPEGFAKTQEKGREIITDSSDNIKSWGSNKGTRIDYLKKGDKVINAEKTKKIIDQAMFMNSLNGLLLENTIGTIPFKVEQKNDNLGVISEIKALRNDLVNSQSSLIITRDKRGERTFEYKNGVKRELLNNSLKGIAKYVK